MSATIIAVANQKGGTGKTTTCENLGIGLANKGKHVLLVDTDPQASLTIALGYPRPDDLPVTLTDLMTNVMQERPVKPEEAILSHTEGVDLIPASIMLSGLEVSLVNAMSRETVLKQILESVKSQYDYILLDCMPSRGHFQKYKLLSEPVQYRLGISSKIFLKSYQRTCAKKVHILSEK